MAEFYREKRLSSDGIGEKHACGRIRGAEHIVIDSAPVLERRGKRERYGACAGRFIFGFVISRADFERF